MQYLLLQTFAWMCFAGVIGAILGCMARRFLGASIEAGELAPAGGLMRKATGMAAPAPAPVAVSGARPTAPAAPAPVAKGPKVEGVLAPAPVGVSTVRPAPSVEAYPITTVGIPRGAPELVQPQIQTITLPPVAAMPPAPAVTASVATPVTAPLAAPIAAAVATSAVSTAAIVTPSVAQPAASALKADAGYPITTIGLPGYKAAATPGSVASAPVAATVNTPPAVAPIRPADTARFEDALRGQAQPRPEPLRPELARPPSTQTPAAVAPVTPAAVAPIPVTPKPTAVQPADVPFTAVAASGAALAALAERAAAASAAETRVASGNVAPPAPVVVTPVAPEAAPVVAIKTTEPAASVAPVGAADDLTRIRTIDASMQARLASAGVMRFSDIARWTPADVARISQATGTVGRIEQENWIEQAQILAVGGDTEYSRRRLRGDAAAVVAPSPAVQASARAPSTGEPDAGASGTVTPISAAPSAAAAAAAAAAMAATTAARASTSNSTIGSSAARLSDAIRDNAEKVAEPMGRVLRPDLAGLRSVRSEALRGDGTGSDQSRAGSGRPTSVNDDLKRIRGIGVLIEKKLNSLGVSGYEQVANWTSADIDRVSQILDFKGRIERENWVEQARILASGGQTEFSRRVDRGEA